MPNYRYTARDERGNAVNGTLAAASPEALEDDLKRMGYLVTRWGLADGAGSKDLLERFRRVGHEDLALFNVQLSTMIQVGIPLVTALNVLAQQTQCPPLRRAAGETARSVETGRGFSEALQRHPKIFSPLFIQMIRAGEASGKLEEILKRLAEFARAQAALREQLKTAMTYPALLFVVGVSIVVFLLKGIVPKFIAIFTEAGVPLPTPTLLLSRASYAVDHYWPLLLAAAVGVISTLSWYLRTPAGRRRLDTLLLKLPAAGTLVREAALSRFARTLATLLSGGVPILTALEIVRDSCGNAVIGDVVRTMESSVRQGGALSAPIKGSPEFPPMVVQMILVGETSGSLEEMLNRIADHYDERVRHGVQRLTTLVEPLFLGVMAGMVAFIMASVLLPLFRMVNVIK